MIWILSSLYLIMNLNLKNFFFFNSIIILDYTSLFMFSIMPLIMVIIFMYNFNSENNKSLNMYIYLFLILMIMISSVFLISDNFMFIVMTELCVYPMSYLLLNLSKDKDKISAMMFMFSMNMLGSLPFMFYVMSINKYISIESINDLFVMQIIKTTTMLIFFMLMLIFKVPLFMLHLWLTKAHVSASGPCSMILASIMLKLGTFGLYKFMKMFTLLSTKFMVTMLCYSIISYIMVSFIMIRIFDIKYMIACSSILHMSMVIPFLMIHNYESVISSMFMMVGHGLISYYLFYLISLKYENLMSRNLDLNKSLESTHKNLTMMIFIFMFLNIGLPPLMSFYAEFLFMISMMKVSMLLSLILMLMMLISIMFLMLYLTKILFGKKYNLSFTDYNYKLNYNSYITIMSLFLINFMN